MKFYDFLRSDIYALHDSFMHVIESFVNSEIEASEISASNIWRGVSVVGKSIAVLKIRGAIIKSDFYSDAWGIAGTDAITSALDVFTADKSIETIVLDIDSPGGSVYGVQELADKIFETRQKKKVIAIANPLAASAAYWLGTAASEFYATPSGEVGSVGVIMVHFDESKNFENEGIKVTVLQAGEYKGEGNPFQPLSQSAIDFNQQRLNEYYAAFVNSVARYRGVSPVEVVENFGKGRVYGAEQAMQSRMVDGVRTSQQMFSSLVQKEKKKSYINAVRNKIDLI